MHDSFSLFIAMILFFILSIAALAYYIGRRSCSSLARCDEDEVMRLSRIAKETHNGVIITDPDGRIDWINEGFTRITGYEIGDIRAQLLVDFLKSNHPDEQNVATFEHAIQNAEPFNIRMLIHHHLGHFCWVSINCNPLFDEQDNLQGFMAINTDISEQKKNEIEIKRQAELLESMSQQGRIGAWEFDLVNDRVYWSPMTKKIHGVDEGYTPTVATSLGFCKPGESRDALMSAVKQCAKDGKPWSIEFQLLTQSGQEIWVAATGKAELENGRCVRIFGSFQDINERKVNQLNQLYAFKHNKILANLTVHPDIVAGEFDAAIKLILEKSCRALGIEQSSFWMFEPNNKELICRALYRKKVIESELPAYGAVPAEYYDGEEINALLPFGCREGSPYFDCLFKGINVVVNDVSIDDRTMEFYQQYYACYGIKSSIDTVVSSSQGLVGVMRFECADKPKNWSVSEESFCTAIATLVSSVYDRQVRKKTEARLIQAIEKANAAVQAKSYFMASMSHEIRTPMNGVLGMLGLVLKSSLSKHQERKLRIAQKSAESLLRIINDILDFSKIDAGQIILEESSFNLYEIFFDACEDFFDKAAKKNIDLRFDIESVSQANWVGDPARIKQILVNLVSNAIKFTSAGSVFISAVTARNDYGVTHLHCDIRDTGIGVPSEKTPILFDAFTQADASNTRQFGGTGLGLSIVKELCQLMGGEVSVTSEEGKGSCFSFFIKLEPCMSSDKQGKPWVLPYLELSGKKAFIVCGKDSQADGLVKRLRTFDVMAQASPFEYQNNQFHDADFYGEVACDIIFIMPDSHMPVDRAVSQIREIYGDYLPIVVVSADSVLPDVSPSDAVKNILYSSLNMDDVIFKRLLALVLDDILLSFTASSLSAPFLESFELSYEQPAKAHRPWKGARVLLVDDDAVNCDVAVGILSELGVHADIAMNGQEALEALRKVEEKASQKADAEGAYQMIFMDCQMPILDGFEATRLIRDGHAGLSNQTIPIVAMTASALLSDKKRCLECGMNDYLAKPFLIDDMVTLLNQYLSKDVPNEPLSSSFDRPAIESSVPSFNSEAHQLPAATWDKEILLKRISGRQDRLTSLVGLFIEQYASCLEDVRQQMAQQDFDRAAKLCHGLKGAAGNLGALAFMAASADLDVYCSARANNKPPSDSERVAKQLFDRFEVEYHALMAALESHQEMS